MLTVGFFAATGIPLMALAMANIASMLITVGDPDEAEKIIAAKVTPKELHHHQCYALRSSLPRLPLRARPWERVQVCYHVGVIVW